jgi:hypothetical protein
MDNDDLTDYAIYGFIILLIIAVIWIYFQKDNLQTLYNKSLNVQSQLNVQSANDVSQLASLKAQLDKLNAQITAQKPQADELAQYKSIISSNLYASLKASNAIFGSSTNPRLLQNIADVTANISIKVGPALCEYAQILAKTLLQSFDAHQIEITRQICDSSSRAALVIALNGRRGEFENSQVITIIIATFDLLQAYFCSNRTRDNLVNIVKALVNVICNPSPESKQLYSALYKQMLLDLDNNYKNGSPNLVSNPGIRTTPQTINYQTQWGSYNQTTPGYYNLSKVGDPVLDELFSQIRVGENN